MLLFAFELNILKAIESLRTDFGNTFFKAITMIGEELPIILLVAILFFAIDKHLARRIFFISMTSLGINSVIKNTAKVPRPFASGEVTSVYSETATGYAFPSAHTQTFATWSTLLARHIRKYWFSILVGVMILLIGFSRMYLGVHYPSDVIVGMLLGVLVAIGGDIIYQKVDNKQLLHIAVALIFTPFAIYYLIFANPLYEDFFKLYGMALGLPISVFLEERYANLTYDVPMWKKIVRVVLAVVIALAIKEGVKLLNVFESVHISLLLDAVRYMLVMLGAFGVYPILCKKCKL